MKLKVRLVLATILYFSSVCMVSAQDLGPLFKKMKDGIYVYTGKPSDSNCTIILTQEGVVLVDSGNIPVDSQAVMKAVKQLTSQPIRFLINRRETAAKRTWDNKPIEWDRLAKEIEAVADKDAIFVEEFGSQRNKCLDHLSLGYGAKTQLGRTTGECLGWGLPASIGVKLAKPDHQVWALQGDGGMLFNQTEALWPMRRHEAPIITVIFNNRSYNETRNRMWSRGKNQREKKLDRLSHLGNPDVNFAKIAEAYDIKGEVVANPNDIAPALKRAIQATRDGQPYLLDVLVAQAGQGANLNWYPKVSIAEMRTKKA